VVQFIAGAGHVDARNLRAMAGRCGIDVDDSQRIAPGRVGLSNATYATVSTGACIAIVGDG
jgi:hypothetical protein